MIRDFLPGAVYLLDLFHLKRRIREVLRDEADSGLLEQVQSACAKGDPATALRLLAGHTPTEEKAEVYRKLLHYIKTNALGIANYANSDLFGSGCVEKGVDLIVSRRFKGEGPHLVQARRTRDAQATYAQIQRKVGGLLARTHGYGLTPNLEMLPKRPKGHTQPSNPCPARHS